MTLKSYLILMGISSSLCWVVFAFVVSTIDPMSTNWLGFLLFYCSLGLSLAGSFSIIGFLVRFKIMKKALVFRQVAEAFRQSFLMSILIVVILLLLSRDLFTWVNLVLLVLGIFFLEYFWVSRTRSRIIRRKI